MTFPSTSDFGSSDKTLLIAFLREVFALLSESVGKGQDHLGNPLFVEELIPPMRAAFPSIGQHFGRVEKAIEEMSDGPINEHGLSGVQLRFKLAAVSYRERVYRRIGQAAPFRWLLDTLEGLLDSILDAAGTGGAIKEFKEAVRNSTKDQ